MNIQMFPATKPKASKPGRSFGRFHRFNSRDVLRTKKVQLDAAEKLPPPAGKKKRKLGMLAGKVKIRMARDFSLTDEEFLRGAASAFKIGNHEGSAKLKP